MSNVKKYIKLGLEEALERLRNNDQTLAHLKLEGEEIGDEGAREITHALTSNHELRGLNLRGKGIGDEGARVFADALKKNGTLEELNLGGNDIGTEGARVIADALKENGTLDVLNLAGNDVGAEGARVIADALKANDALKALNLEYNGIGDEGAHVIAEALKANGTLKLLNLEGDEIGDEGARAMAEAMRSNGTLSKLVLEFNAIGTEGAHAFARAFRMNNTLADLEWDGNGGADIIEKMRRHKKEFSEGGRSLYFGVNDDGSPSGLKCAAWEAATGYGHELAFVHEALRNLLDENNKSAVKKLLDDARSRDGSPLLHIAAGFDSEEAFEFCKFLVVEVGADFDAIVDKSGRTARQIAEGNECTTEWARSIGTFLGRYLIEREGHYKSPTCTVHFAVDVKKTRGNEDRNVAVKIMNDQKHFKHELEQRLGENQKHAESGEDIKSGWNLFHADHVVPLLRYHEEEKDEKWHLCLVMPQGGRNLLEMINCENIAGNDVDKILFFAKDSAKSLRHLHQKGVVHCDFKPRNIVPIHMFYKLIDFDGSVSIGEPLTEKSSSGYFAPEIAQVRFRPEETLEDLEARRRELKEKLFQALEMDDDEMTERVADELRSVKGKIKQLKSSGLSKKTEFKADERVDIWSYGVVLFEMLTGTKLLACDVNDNLLDEHAQQELVNWRGISEDKLNLVLKDCADRDLVEDAKELLRKCLCTKDSRLQNFHQVLSHPFFSRKTSQMRSIEKKIENVQTGITEVKEGNEKLIKGQQEITEKLSLSLKLISELQTQLLDVTGMMEKILPDTTAPRLMCIVPLDSSAKDWMNFQTLFLKRVKVIFICPVTYAIPRDGKNRLMGYPVTLSREWFDKYGPILKMSFEVLQVALAIGRLTTGLPFPNISSVGQDTNIFSILKDNLDLYIPKDENGNSKVPDLAEIEAMVGDEATVTLPSSDESPAFAMTEGIQIIQASYDQVKEIAEANRDPKFLKTGLVKVEKDGDSKDCEYVLDNDKIKALYKQEGRKCIGPTPEIGLNISENSVDVGPGLNAVVKEGMLASSIVSMTNMRRKKAYFVLQRNGILNQYKTKKEWDDDVHGVRGKPHPRKVLNIVPDGKKEDRFHIDFEDNKRDSFQCLLGRDEAKAWVQDWARIRDRSAGAVPSNEN